MKRYKAVFNPEENTGVYGVSLVQQPAMEGVFIALSKEEIQLKAVDKEQRILIGLVLEPNKPIYRNQNGEEFTIEFDEQTIKELSFNFFKRGYQKNSTIEHEKNNIEGVTFVESWLVENSEVDKSTNFGMSYPKGSWLATMKVDSDEIWDNFVKTGKVKGFSIDAFLSLEEIEENVNLKCELNMNVNEIVDAIKIGFSELTSSLKDEKQVEVSFGMLKSEDEQVTFEFEGEMLSVGSSVWVTAEDDTKVPVPVGEYPLENNLIMVIEEEGVVAQLVEKPSEEAVQEDAPAEVDASNVTNSISEAVNQIKSVLVKYNEDNAKKFDELNAKIVELSKTTCKQANCISTYAKRKI
jgi:hypothetical protein